MLKKHPLRWLALAAFPFIFIFSGGWTWVLAVFWIGASSALLRLKIFFAGFLLSFLGSRWMSLAISTLAFSFLFPPSEGHWSAGLSWALLMDGVLLGSFCSPFKGYERVLFVSLQNLDFLLFLRWLGFWESFCRRSEVLRLFRGRHSLSCCGDIPNFFEDKKRAIEVWNECNTLRKLFKFWKQRL